MRLHLVAIALIAAATAAAAAHVGTSNAYFEGAAGPYGIRVIVRTPGVIPGLAQASVRILGGGIAERVTMRPLRSDVGLEGAPPADVAGPVRGEPDLYSGELWLMTAGSYSIEVTVSGAAGDGTVMVPVMAVAERSLEMHWAVGLGLAAAALFLFFGAVTIFGAAVRESVLQPGAEPDRRSRRRGTHRNGARRRCAGRGARRGMELVERRRRRVPQPDLRALEHDVGRRHDRRRSGSHTGDRRPGTGRQPAPARGRAAAGPRQADAHVPGGGGRAVGVRPRPSGPGRRGCLRGGLAAAAARRVPHFRRHRAGKTASLRRW